MTDSKSCHPVTIARNDVAHLQRCEDCGCISIHVGHATLRLDESALFALWSALGHALTSISPGATPAHLGARGIA